MWIRYLFAAACAALFAPAAQAQVPGDVVQISILPGWREADGRHIAGLSIRLAKGWKTYWRAPGDGGIPPEFNWSGSSNLAGAEVRFPVPEVFDQNGLRSIGYRGEVIFPLVLQAERPGDPIRLEGEIEIGVCEEVCVPVSARVMAELPAPGADSGLLRAALADRPQPGAGMDCEISPISDGLVVRITTRIAPMADDEVAIVEATETGLWISQAALSRDGQSLTAEVEMVPPDAKPFALARGDVRLTVLAGGRAVEIEGCD